jgi:hypothetical protein
MRGRRLLLAAAVATALGGGLLLIASARAADVVPSPPPPPTEQQLNQMDLLRVYSLMTRQAELIASEAAEMNALAAQVLAMRLRCNQWETR